MLKRLFLLSLTAIFIVFPVGFAISDSHDLSYGLDTDLGALEGLYRQSASQMPEDSRALMPQDAYSPDSPQTPVEMSVEQDALYQSYKTLQANYMAKLQRLGESANTGNLSEAGQAELIDLGQSVVRAAGQSYIQALLKGSALERLMPRSSEAGDAAQGKQEDANFLQTLFDGATTDVYNASYGIAKEMVESSLSGNFSDGSDLNFSSEIDALLQSSVQRVVGQSLSAARDHDLFILRTMELDYRWNNLQNSYFSLILTQPIYQTNDLMHSVFLQGGGIVNEQSVDIDDDVARHTANLGLAYRYLPAHERYLLGVNIFFDHQWPYNHSRMSIGGDIQNDTFMLSGNYYHPVSDYRTSRTSDDGLVYEERTLRGFDMNVNYEPFEHDFSLNSGVYQYFREQDPDIKGVSIGAQYALFDYLNIKANHYEENGDADRTEIALSFEMPLYNPNPPNLVSYDLARGNAPLRNRIFNKVERSNSIRVEERLKADQGGFSASFRSASIGLPFVVGSVSLGAGVSIPQDTAITIPANDFAIIDLSDGSVINVSASAGGSVILEYNSDLLTVIQTNGGFVQYISTGSGITTINVPGGTVDLTGTEVDITDTAGITTVQVRSGQVNVVPDIGSDTQIGNIGDIISLIAATGVTDLLTGAGEATRQENAFTNLDKINPDPTVTADAAAFIAQDPALITNPESTSDLADIRVTFSKAVSVSGVPHLEGTIKGVAREFDYNAGVSTSTQLVFRYTYQAADASAPSITITDLDLNGGTITTTDNGFSAITAFTDVTGIITASDMTPPVLSSSTPADNATAVTVNTNITLNFDENIVLNSGNITLYKTIDDTQIMDIDVVSDAGLISGDGTSTITINPASDLPTATEFYILIDAGTFDDTLGNSYVGISSTTALSFRTPSPLDIAGLEYWFDAAEASTILDASDNPITSGNVAKWLDKSGSANDAEQTTDSSRPSTGVMSDTVNGLNTLTIVTDRFDIPSLSTGNYTLIFASRQDTARTGASSAQTRATILGNISSNVFIPNGLLGNTNVDIVTGSSINSWYVNGGTSSFPVNRDEVFDFLVNDTFELQVLQGSITGDFNQLLAGRYNRTFQGVLGEVLIFNSNLSSADVNQIGNYLSDKWGGTWSDVP